ncbi:MAG: hypothetical protein Q8R24_10735, partial [Legionellaceae bacterium]|nr:hypothetical protein [Legionellaceae bacterium]
MKRASCLSVQEISALSLIIRSLIVLIVNVSTKRADCRRYYWLINMSDLNLFGQNGMRLFA